MRRRSANCLGAAALSLLAGALLAGCAAPRDPYAAAPASEQLARSDALGDCLRRLQQLDARIEAAGVRDAQEVRVDGFPFLRADRATVARSPATDAMAAGGAAAGAVDAAALAQAQVERMAALDAEARTMEAANLRLDAAELAALQRCRADLLAALRADARATDAAVAAAVPPEAYNDALRVVGLYPISKFPFVWGVAAWQQSTRDLFATPFPELPVRGKRIRYVPGAAGSGPVAGLLPSDAETAPVLRMPSVSPARAWQLLMQHAPVIVVDTVDDNDRIGRLVWRQSGSDLSVVVDTREPLTYVRVAWAEFAGRPAIQLVYTFWFPARPIDHPLDLVGGRLDALVWRVTLDPKGRPLVYDSIHACGCFHMFFPTERVRERPGPLEHEGLFDETMFSPQVVYSPGPDERVMVFLGSGDHNILRVAVDQPRPAPGVPYRLEDENTLRRLPLPAAAGGGTRSIFGPDGLVPGSERAERLLFWPMGVPSAGQMRQWGHHATAFVGRRHFDDPRLIDRYFSLAPGAD
jgi:hypothetical protein